MDELISSYLAALAGCLCVEANTVSPTCFCGVTLGDQFISMSGFGDCEEDCGEAWVRITSAYPAVAAGVPPEGPARCGATLGFDIEMGIMRCIQIPDGGESPTPDSLLAASNLQIKDMLAMQRAILCCDHFPDVQLGTWLPSGPTTGLVGGTWTLSVAL